MGYVCFYCLVFKDFITKMKLNQVNPQNVNENKQQQTTRLHIRKQEKPTLLEDLMLMMLLPS